MHRALFELMRLRFVARTRRMLHGLRSPKSVLFTIVGAGLLALFVVPILFSMNLAARTDPASVQSIMKWGLFAYCIITTIFATGERAEYARPRDPVLLQDRQDLIDQRCHYRSHTER